MPATRLPPALADVAGPLKEAAAYEELQRKRRSAAWNGLVATIFLVLAARRFFAQDLPLFVFANLLFVLSTWYLWVHRRPKWKALFHDPGEPPLSWTHALVLAPLLLLFGAAMVVEQDAASDAVRRAAAVAAILVASLGVPLAALALHPADLWARHRASIGAMAASGLVALPVAFGAIPAAFGMATWFLAFGAASGAIALARAFAPRRWLVRG